MFRCCHFSLVFVFFCFNCLFLFIYFFFFFWGGGGGGWARGVQGTRVRPCDWDDYEGFGFGVQGMQENCFLPLRVPIVPRTTPSTPSFPGRSRRHWEVHG